jgi:hypothetical protein
MTEKTEKIFGNAMPSKTVRKAEKTKQKFLKKFGDDGDAAYSFAAAENPVLAPLGTRVLVEGTGAAFDEKSLIVGNIRMGFGHYRISMAMASCANALGYHPLWLDLNAFPRSSCTKIISHQNDLYSLGSRLSDRSKLFNKLYWEPLNSEGFRKLSYNACDQASAEIMANLLKSLPKETPFVATHVWPAQAAVHAGFRRVVNAIPDNWPMALHLAQGSLHTVQTQSAFLGYKALRGMDRSRSLRPMPQGALFYTGHYVDHELVVNLEHDTQRRLERVQNGKAKRYLLTVGGAGAQREIFVRVIRTLLPEIRQGRAVLFLNVGDHQKVWEEMRAEVPELGGATLYQDDYESAAAFAEGAVDGEASGIYAFCHRDIFGAVDLTNLLMRSSDVLVTKPSELSFYPIPKLFIHRVGGHEAYGAIRSSEMGDGTYECETPAETADMIHLMQSDGEVLTAMNQKILKNKTAGLYDGAYNVIRLATGQGMGSCF